jgi:tetratricopeptide (TPR) repeat protein
MLESDSKDLSALAGRAAVRILMGDAQGAQEDFDAAIAIDEEQGQKMKFAIADRSIWRARELDMKERFPESLKIYDVLLTMYPEQGMAYHDRGGLKTRMGDYAGAIADLGKAIEFDSGNNSVGDSYTLRARAKRAAGDEAGALEDEKLAEERFETVAGPLTGITFDFDRILTDAEKSAVFSLLMDTLGGSPGRTASSIQLSTHTSIDVDPVEEVEAFIAAIDLGELEKTGKRKYHLEVDEAKLKQLVESPTKLGK